MGRQEARWGSDPQSEDPNDWPISGSAGSGGLYWEGMKFGIGSKVCERVIFLGRKCTTTDKITARVTVNPGAYNSTATYTTIYSPNEYYFSDLHLEFFAINRGRIASLPFENTNSFGPNGGGSYFLSNNEDLHNDKLTVAVRLWGQEPEHGVYIYLGSKTGDFDCDDYTDSNGDPSNSCRY